MFERLSLKNKLFLASAVLAVALVVEAGVGLEVARNMSDNLRRVNDSSHPLNNLKKVSDAYAVGIAGAVEKTRSGQSWEMGRDQLEARPVPRQKPPLAFLTREGSFISGQKHRSKTPHGELRTKGGV